MLKTRFISNCTLDQLDDLKIAALYFDKIEIVEHKLVRLARRNDHEPLRAGEKVLISEVLEVVKADFRSHVSLLQSEGLIEYIPNTNIFDDTIREKVLGEVHRILSSSQNAILLENGFGGDVSEMDNITISNPEAFFVYENFFGKLELGAWVNLRDLFTYFSSLLTSLLDSVANGIPSLTSSPTINNLVKLSFNDDDVSRERNKLAKQLGVSPHIAYEAVKMSVPNVSMLSFEDVLEVRYQLRNQLADFRRELNEIQTEILETYDPEYVTSHAAEFVRSKVEPVLSDLRVKTKDAQIGVLKKLFDEIRDPKAYIPLIGTFFGQIPIHIASLLSIGMIGVSTSWDYVRSIKEIKRNGLYYLISLERRN